MALMNVDAIRNATAALLAAVNSSDVGGVVAVWAEDGVLMPPNRPSVRGRRAIEEYFRRLFETSRFKYTFTASEIVIDAETAVERLEYVAEAWIGDAVEPVRDTGKGVHVYVREGATWKLRLDIWNSDVPR